MSEHTTKVNIASQHGGLEGAFAEPAGAAPAGALVVLQEWHGVNDQMRGKVARFAQEGYLAICPDLYHGEVASDDARAARLMGALDWPRAIADIADTVAYLRHHPRCNGKVGVLGFCMGGALTFAAARHIDGLACAVPFYGLPQLSLDDYAKLRTPISAHFAREDDWAKASIAEDIQRRVRSAGGHMDLYVYDAGHAFMRETDSTKYDEAASMVAWERALAFLKAYLA